MISLCITTYNRFEMLLESFEQILNDDRISEIVIVDDCSNDELYQKLRVAVWSHDKVKLYRNDRNIGMSRNKAKAIELATNPWCILFDSDNVIDSTYLDALPEYLAPSVIYCPDFAKPQFDYRKYSGQTINAENAAKIMSKPMGECVFNTCNYLVNREEYLRVYEYNPDMKGTDTIWFNYLWLRADNSLHVVPGMQYMHRVHAGSGFMADVEYNMEKSKEIKELIQTLR